MQEDVEETHWSGRLAVMGDTDLGEDVSGTRWCRQGEVDTAVTSTGGGGDSDDELARGEGQRRLRDSFISASMGRRRWSEKGGATKVNSVGQREMGTMEKGGKRRRKGKERGRRS